MNTSGLLVLQDRCHRAGWRSIRQPMGPRGVWSILREAIETGLGAEDYRTERASSYVRQAALDCQLEIDTPESIYQISEHLAAIAEQVVHVIGGDKPWYRPEMIALGPNIWWESSVWRDGENLRRLILTDYWSESRMRGEAESWYEGGEQAIYGGSLTEIIVLLGAHRDGRFHGLWSKGWKHPYNSDVRLQSVSGAEFRAYQPFWREDSKLSVQEWADKMPTGLAMHVEQREPIGNAQRKAWKALAMRKLATIMRDGEPDMQPSQCYMRGSRCPMGPCSIS
jgi:hypothetical protein